MSKEELKRNISLETEDLPSEILREVLDFIQFLKSKKFEKSKAFQTKVSKELIDLGSSSISHLEEEFLNYKDQYPRDQ